MEHKIWGFFYALILSHVVRFVHSAGATTCYDKDGTPIRHVQLVAMPPFAAAIDTIVCLTDYASGRMGRFGRVHGRIRIVSSDSLTQSSC